MSPKSEPTRWRAAGCLLWRPTESSSELALVHRKRYGDWSFPKGKLEVGEAWPVAAVREVAEETGQDVALGPPLPTRYYPVAGVPKEVRYWTATATAATTPEPFEPNDEVDHLVWQDESTVRATLSYPHDAELMDAYGDLMIALGGADPDVLIILRHSTAMKRANWRGRDDLRPLQDLGAQEADRLVPLLSAYGITSVHSSDARRCLDTVEPYARARRLPMVTEGTVSERGHRQRPDHVGKRTAELLEGGGRTVLCSHRPVLPAILKAAIGVAGGTSVIGGGLPPSAMVVIHHVRGRVLAIERHEPTGPLP